MAFPFVGVVAKFLAPLLLSMLSHEGGCPGLFFEVKASGFLSAVLFSTYDEVDLSHLTEISDDRLYEIKNENCTVKLNGLKTFSVQQAKIFFEQHGFLYLNGITQLNEPLAEELSKCRCVFVSLNGIKKIDSKSLRKLVSFDSGFYAPVISLGSISVHEMRSLKDFFISSETCATMILDGVEALPLDVAKYFINYHGGIGLNKIRRIDDEALAVLAKSEAHFTFDSLDTITDAQAEVFTTFKCPLSLHGLKKVTDRQFACFCNSENPVSLAGLEELSDRQLQLLSGAKNPIRFKNLRSLPREVVKHYRVTNPSNHTLDFPLVSALDDETVQEFAGFTGVIKLNGLKKLSRKQAIYLGTTKGELQLNGLDSLSPGCAHQLFNQKGAIFLNGLSKIEEESSVYFRSHLGPILLDGLTSITDENARHFSTYIGTLSLAKLPSITDIQMDLLTKKKSPGCASLNASQVEEFFSFEFYPDGDCPLGSSRLILNGLKSLSAQQSESLSRCSYNVELNGIVELTAKQSRDFLELNNDLLLDGVTEIDEDALGILFQRRAHTSLNGIKKISLKHARILAERDHGASQGINLGGVRNLPINHCMVLGAKETAIITLGNYAIDDNCRKALKQNSGIFLGSRSIVKD